ncbi:MAG: hypothetical protein IPL46_18490 [Saprospiraceae bacterium]|nr:hypothetical protein [Saprospiraceae bacterium]
MQDLSFNTDTGEADGTGDKDSSFAFRYPMVMDTFSSASDGSGILSCRSSIKRSLSPEHFLSLPGGRKVDRIQPLIRSGKIPSLLRAKYLTNNHFALEWSCLNILLVNDKDHQMSGSQCDYFRTYPSDFSLEVSVYRQFEEIRNR